MRLLGSQRIIPSVQTLEDAERAADSQCQIVYLLTGSLSTLGHYLHLLRAADKEVMVNLDLFSGLARDSEAVSYLAASGASGIISTHSDILNCAAASRLYTIQRTFMLDSGSVDSSMRSLRHFVPDALELLPGPVAPRILPRLRAAYGNVATIAGGLISGLHEADEIIRAGIDAVSTGNPDFWMYPVVPPSDRPTPEATMAAR